VHVVQYNRARHAQDPVPPPARHTTCSDLAKQDGANPARGRQDFPRAALPPIRAAD